MLFRSWITEVETAASLEDLHTNVSVIQGKTYDFSELSVKLARDLERILSGEFKRKVQVKEVELSKRENAHGTPSRLHDV